jgi:ketosteroid isomerase-like protein
MTDREQLVRRAIAAVNEGDWETLKACIHPEMRLTQPIPDVGQTEYGSFPGTYHGRDETLNLLRRFAEQAEEIQIDLRSVEPVGQDALLYEFVWLIGPDGRRSAQLAWCVSRFKDGLVLSSSIFPTEDAAREAIARGA